MLLGLFNMFSKNRLWKLSQIYSFQLWAFFIFFLTYVLVALKFSWIYFELSYFFFFFLWWQIPECSRSINLLRDDIIFPLPYTWYWQDLRYNYSPYHHQVTKSGHSLIPLIAWSSFLSMAILLQEGHLQIDDDDYII